MLKESVCVRIPKKVGKAALDNLIKMKLVDKTLRIQKDEAEFLCIPLIRSPVGEERKQLEKVIPETRLEIHFFSEKERQENTLPDALADKLPPDLLASLPRALDIVGDIAIVEISPKLKPHKVAVGEAIMAVHRNVQVVFAKVSAVSGVHRLRELEYVTGENRTSTIYKEHGCTYYVDVAKAYFSPRLGTEHARVAALVGAGETVMDLFAGVGPFAVLIAKKQPTAKVFAIDINNEAVELLKKNARLNRVESRVVPIAGDAREVVAGKLQGIADRVIMNLPESALKFIDVACTAIKPSGGTVHFYSFLKMPDNLDELKRRLSETVEKQGRKVAVFQEAKPVRETAPYEYQVVLDAMFL